MDDCGVDSIEFRFNSNGGTMKTIKSAGTVVVVFILGIALGIYLSQPPHVKAALNGVRIQKVTEGYNTVMGSQILGFSCTQADCFIATSGM